MKKECEDLLSLVEDIYETVNDSSHWQAVLSQLSSRVYKGKAAITARDNTSGKVDGLDLAITKIIGISDEYVNVYITDVSNYDVWIPIEVAHDYTKDKICVFSEYLPKQELFKTDFYKNWLQSLEISDGIAVQIFKTENFRIVLNVFYDDDSEAVQELHNIFRVIAPHLHNAVSLWMQANDGTYTSRQKLRTKYLRNEYKVTERELEIVSAYFRLGNAKKVANNHGIEEDTVRDHVKHVRVKMKCNDTHELMLKLFSYSDQAS